MHVTMGFALILIAFTAEWLLKNRLKDPKLAKRLMWVAWIAALLGGVASQEWPRSLHVGGPGALAVSVIGLLFIAVDLTDRRPDWAAVILIALVPGFMAATTGWPGDLFHLLLYYPTVVVNNGFGSIGA